MRRARAGPRRWHELLALERDSGAAVGDHDRRRIVAVTETQILSEHRHVGVIRGVEHLGPALAQRGALWGLLIDLGAAGQGGEQLEFAGAGADIVERDGLALDLVALEQPLAAPALQHGRELPADIQRVLQPGMEAEPAGRRILMRGVAGDEDALAVAIAGRDALAPLPMHDRDHLVWEIAAGQAAHVIRRVVAFERFQYREPPGFAAIDADDLAPGAAGIGEAEEARPALVVQLHQRARAEVDIRARGEDAHALVIEIELGRDRAVGAVTADEILRFDDLALAGQPIRHGRAHAVRILLETIETRHVPQGYRGQRAYPLQEDRVVEDLGAAAIRLGGERRMLLGVGRDAHAGQDRPGHAGTIEEVVRPALRPAGAFDLFGDAPAAVQFHAAHGESAHLRHAQRAVAALDQGAWNSGEAELDSERQPDRAAA